jgi:hypothetical protein
MGNPFDQLAKKIGLRALGPSGFTAVEHEIPSNAHRADLRHDPDPSRRTERARLGLLGRLASVACLVEFFSSAPGEEKVIDCVGKLLAFRQEQRCEADRATREENHEGQAKPAPRFVKPFLWIISAGRPSNVLSLLGAVPAKGWPQGVYLSPGTPLDAGATGPPELGGMLRVGIVVASELPRERSTILVRIMAGGAALPAALADLAALPPGAHEREVASMDVLELRRALGSKPNRTVEEEEYVVSTQDAFEELREEGRAEGRTEEAARAVLTALRVRGIPVGDAARERILAQKDRSLLERWLERAIVVASVGEVFGEPS